MAIFNQPPRGLDVQQSELLLAGQKLGLATQGLLTSFHPTAVWGLNNHTIQKIGSAVEAVPGANGTLDISTGASASSAYHAIMGAQQGGGFGVPFRSGQAWYISGRFAVTSAVTAQTTAGVGTFNFTGASVTQLGVSGSVSTGFFTLNGPTGSPITTTVAVDTSFHTHRAWRANGTTVYSVDGVEFTGNIDLNAASGPMFQILNGTDAVARTMSMVWYFGAGICI